MHTMNNVAARPLMFRAVTAAELMTSNPMSLRARATLAEARDLFISKAIHAAPVIDEAGHPVGVLSHSDIMVHDAVGPIGATMAVADLMRPAGAREVP